MRIALVTCSIGGIDEVKQPVKQNTAHDYFVYDENNLPFPLPNLNNRLKAKYIKCQTHRFLPGYDVYVYIDGRVEVIKETFIEEFVAALQKKDIVVVDHKERKNVFEEMDYIIQHIKKGNYYLSSRYEDQQMEKELAFYEAHKEDLKDVGLYGGGFFARWNSKKVNDCFDDWWKRTIEFSYFDQAMLAYCIGFHELRKTVLNREDTLGNLLHLGKHHMEHINLSWEGVYNQIKDHLRRKEALAVIRYGDGEAMLMDPNEGDSREYKTHVFKRQLGGDTSDDDKKQIIENLSIAYNSADVIGIPTPRHERKEGYWQKAIPILKDKLNENKDFCSIDIHFDFLNNDIYEKLLRDRENVFYINSNNIDEGLKNKYGVKNVYSYIISPEMKFTPDYNGIKHYPNHFNKIRNWIDSVGCRGELCLVGAGVVGKMYCIWFKERGGIAFDAGSIFDLWGGRNTRGPTREANSEDLTYKL